MKLKLQSLKDFIKSVELSASDIFLAVGFLFSVIFYAFAWQFMVTEPHFTSPSHLITSDTQVIPCPPWLCIICFTATCICWGVYFYLEIKKGHVKSSFTTWFFILFVIWGLIGVLVQPSNYTIDVTVRALNNDLPVGANIGDIVVIGRNIPWEHKMFFAMGSVLITTIFYIIFINLSRRIKHINFLVLISIFVFVFMIVLCSYSYITESDHYIPFLQALFKGDIEEAYKHTVCSFIAQRVPYGVCMSISVMFALISHAITKKWYFYLIGAFFYVNMIFSYCKTSLALTALAIVLYLIYRLIVTFKEHKKRNTVITVIVCSFVGVGLILATVSLISGGKFIPLFYKIFTSFTDQRTIETRTFIWGNTYHLLDNGWWILGRGFGTYNYMLYPMNLINGDDVCPSHSTFNAILGAGGVLAIIGYFALLGYYVYLFVKCVKQDWKRTIEFSIPVFVYLIYSITEGINYIVITFMFPLILYSHMLERKKGTEPATLHNWFY